MTTDTKAKLHSAYVRIVPLLIGWAVGRGYLSSGDGNVLIEVAMILSAFLVTAPGSTAFRHNREKMVRANLVDGE